VNRASYGGECTIANAATGDWLGRFWIELDFDRRRRGVTVAVLDVPETIGGYLYGAGALLFKLDDGRQLRGAVSAILKKQTLVALTPEH
jgi:hypothetical protein